MKAKYTYIRASGVRQLAKENGKKCGSDFLGALDRFVADKVKHCCEIFNGHKKKLDLTVLQVVTGKIKI